MKEALFLVDVDENNIRSKMGDGPNEIDRLPKVVEVKDQPCQQLYEG